MITDGVTTLNKERTIPEANNCHAAGIHVFTVGISHLIDEQQLKMVSSPQHQKGINYWTTPDSRGLNAVLESVKQATCKLQPSKKL